MGGLNYVLSHVHVYASQPEVTVTWLTDGLGGVLVSRHQYEGYPEEFVVGLGGHVIKVRGRKEQERFVQAGPRSFGWDHIGLSVKDVAATVAALKERGVEPVTSFDNGFSIPDVIAFVRGPDELWVEITPLEYEPPPNVVLARRDNDETS